MPGITIGCISAEASDLLDRIMAEWREHWKKLPEKHRIKDPEDVYGFAYWLVRWSGLVAPAERKVSR